MANPGPKRLLIPTIKKKISTLSNLIATGSYTSIIKTILHYINIFFNKIGFFEIPYLPYNILTYYNLTNKKFTINSTIGFGSIGNKFFENKLLNCKLYLEYGSGSSTILADRQNVNYYSIESDKHFYRTLKKPLKSKNYFLKDFGIVKEGSTPVLWSYRKFFLRKRIKKYANDILQYLNEKNLIPDLILIDGRYRILCALYVYKFLRKRNCSSTVIIDDYTKRSYLHIVENFFGGQTIGRFGVFDKLKEFKNIDKLIKIYSNDFR
jgi:hypothetical protein